MSDSHSHAPDAAVSAGAVGHDDPMSHVPPGSLWPLLVTLGLIILPFGVLSYIGGLKTSHWGPLSDPNVGLAMIAGGAGIFFFCLMGWANQIIREKVIAHDPAQQQKDLQMFILLFLCSEATAFSAIFGFFYHRQIHDAAFGPPHGMHFGGPLVAYATFLLLSSSITCEIAHHALESGKVFLTKLFLVATLILGGLFLGMTGYEWGELMQRGFTPYALGENSSASFAAIFYTGTGFHAVHVTTGLVMLFLVLLRLEAGHFQQKRTFAMAAASWYWHFVDIVWVLLFITVYVVA